MSFERLVAEGASLPITGWDFSWFEGPPGADRPRATEQRPPWGYAGLAADALGRAEAALDVQTGGAEVLAEALARTSRAPRRVAATESWPPNLALARQRLADAAGDVRHVEDDDPLPFPDGTFDLVLSRHPTVVGWPEIARVLAPGGRYLSQQVGAASMHALSEALLGPFEPGESRSPEVARAAAEAAGLEVVRLERARLRTVFYDVAAVVFYLRLVIWIVPGFAPEEHRDALRRIHHHIERNGSWAAHSTRFLIEAVRR